MPASERRVIAIYSIAETLLNKLVKQVKPHLMKNYRVIKDNFLGYEAQVRYVWFPFVWFQMNDFYWINTWPSSEHAIHFIEQKKAGKYQPALHHTTESSSNEFEKEVKLLEFHPKNLKPEVVWNDTESATIYRASNRRRWWPAVFNPING